MRLFVDELEFFLLDAVVEFFVEQAILALFDLPVFEALLFPPAPLLFLFVGPLRARSLSSFFGWLVDLGLDFFDC